MRRPPAPLAPSDPTLDVDLEEMLERELPPCEIIDRADWEPLDKPPCGAHSVGFVVLVCTNCGPRPRACCRKHLRALRRREFIRRATRFSINICFICARDLAVRGLS